MLSLMLALLSAATVQTQGATASASVIVTTGEAVVRRAPDRAFVTLAVESRASNPREAMRQNSDAMLSVQKRLTEARLPKETVRTLGYGLEQEFDFVEQRRIPRGFVARNSIEVTLDDVGRTGEIIDAAVQAGATSVGGVRFDLQDRPGVEREVLRLAVVDARGRADAAAAGAGRVVDRVLRMEDARQGEVPPPMPMLAMRAGPAGAETPIAPGLIEVRAKVTLTVSMK
jgi:uncharacterized protein YggE